MIRSQEGETIRHTETAIVIPARMAASRLPGKPLAMIGDLPMIVHVYRRAIEASLGPVFVACGETEIAEAVKKAGGQAVMTDPDLPSGTDRIHRAIETVDPEGRFRTVINLQGDIPTLDPNQLVRSVLPLQRLGSDIGTLVNRIDDEAEINDPAKVKAVVSWADADVGRAHYFTRTATPWGDGPYWHHSGIYAFERETLRKMTALAPSPLEKREKLEQLRALENGMTVGVAAIQSAPFGVDTPADLDRARSILA